MTADRIAEDAILNRPVLLSLAPIEPITWTEEMLACERVAMERDERLCAKHCGTDRHLTKCAVGIGGPMHSELEEA